MCLEMTYTCSCRVQYLPPCSTQQCTMALSISNCTQLHVTIFTQCKQLLSYKHLVGKNDSVTVSVSVTRQELQ